MTLQYIPLENLHPSKANVRKIGAKEIADLVPSIDHLGLLQPLLVRPAIDSHAECFEIIAGQRRYHALCKIAETKDVEPVPCLVMTNDDDATAIEASLAENIARLPMDEIDQFKAFAALIAKGVDIEDIASRFGVTTRLVKQRLAIANLYAPILTAYRKDTIEASTIRSLTMASKAKQKEWWTLFAEDSDNAPTGNALKSWLFGGAEIPTAHALFPLEDYTGKIIADLFSDHQYFDDAKAFWERQNQAIAARRLDYRANGWQEVIILDVGTYWTPWEHVKTPKKDGGKVFVEIRHDGEVTFHEGYIDRLEAKRREKLANGETDDKPPKPEITKAMQNYLALHRHAAVRAQLLECSGLALRVATAQIIAGSSLWSVKPERQRANTTAIEDSLAANQAEPRFAQERQAILDMLDLKQDGELIYIIDAWKHDLPTILSKLMTLDDEAVMRIFTFAVAETLPCGNVLVEMLGQAMEVDVGAVHKPDDVFFDLLKDKQAINAALEEVTSKRQAASHISDTAKVQKAALRNAIRASQPDWTPRYFKFPIGAYTDKGVTGGGIPAFDHWSAVAQWMDDSQEESDEPQAKAA